MPHSQFLCETDTSWSNIYFFERLGGWIITLTSDQNHYVHCHKIQNYTNSNNYIAKMKIQNAVSILLFVTLASTRVFAEENAAQMAECDSKDTCEDCLNLGFCDYYHGLCSHNSMVIMDVARYTIGEGSSVDEVCARAATDKANDNLCASQKDCAGCTSSILADGVSSCRWFESEGFCTAGCNMLGCGETTCSAEPSVLPEVPGTPEAPAEPAVLPEVPGTPEAPAATVVNSDEFSAAGGIDHKSGILFVLAVLSVILQ